MASCVTEMGGSIEWVFQRADLPMGLLEAPDTPVRLREHFRLLMMGSREVGDDFLGARVGRKATIKNLGVFGKWVTQAPTLYEALLRANATLPYTLQSATRLVLRFKKQRAIWSYEIDDPVIEGRRNNELLALCYMIAVAVSIGRPFTSLSGRPDTFHGCARTGAQRQRRVSKRPGAIAFDPRLLATRTPGKQPFGAELSADDLEHAFGMPGPGDLVQTTSALIALDLLDGFPSLDLVSSRVGLNRRTLQRRL